MACVIAASAAASAAPARPPNDPAIEQKIRADVAAVSAEAATAFDAGNAARDAGSLDEAAAQYARAAELAPGVDHPQRRACTVLFELGRGDDAFAACEAAMKLNERSPYNQSAMAMALLQRRAEGDLPRALDLARAASVELPKDVSVLQTLCFAALDAGDEAAVRGCSGRLLAADPDGALANYVAALVAGSDGEFARARQHLDRARAAGMPLLQYEELSTQLAQAESAAEGSALPLPGEADTILRIALYVLAGWLGGLVLLLTTGYVLSRLTLGAVHRVTTTGGATATGSAGEQRLRRVYKAVILLLGVYFYVSIPILILGVIAAGGGAIYFFFAIGTIPIKLVLILGILVVVTVGAIMRGLFVRGAPENLGERVALEQQPRLRAVLEDIAREVGTRPVDSVYLTPETDMAVTERGNLWKAVRGRGAERCLIMGVGLFDGMTQIQLRSVLAHEHGHFRNADTAGGGFALAVRRSMYGIIIRMAQSGAATSWNPAWWFLRGFHRVYLVITQGASRLQEVLADRWAIQAYGSAAFVAGYRHVVSRSVRFEHHIQSSLKEVIEHERALANIYRYECTGPTKTDLVERDIETAMTRQPTAYDSHPAPSQRIAWATTLAVTRTPTPDDDLPVWDLFDDRDRYERLMTAVIRDAVHANHGVEIAAEAAGDPEAASG